MKGRGGPMELASESPRGGLADTVAFRAFYGEALPHVYGYLLHRCGGSASVAEDLTQETFLALVSDIKRGKRVDDSVAWVIGIARHKLLDHFRREARDERKLALAWEADPVDDAALVGELPSRARALAALARLPDSQRAALALRYLDGLSVPEVAEALGRSLHATESLLARGREGFKRAYLEAHDE